MKVYLRNTYGLRPSIKLFSTPLFLMCHGEPGAYPMRQKTVYTLDRMPVLSQGTHTFTDYRHFRDASQPTISVFELREETGVTGKTPEAWGEHSSSTHTWWRPELNPNPGEMSQTC